MCGRLGSALCPRAPKATAIRALAGADHWKKAELAVGAATSVAAARTALAGSSDVGMDAEGRMLISGAVLSTQRPQGSFEEAAVRNRDNNSCSNSGGCT